MAIKVEREIEINRPPSEVFEYLSDGENLPRWMDEFESVEKASQGPIGLGTTYRYRMKRGAASTFEWEEFEPGQRLTWHGPPAGAGMGSVEPKGEWVLQPSATGTRLRMTMSPKLGGLMKLLAPMMRRAIGKSSAHNFEQLKQELERRPGEGAGTDAGATAA